MERNGCFLFFNKLCFSVQGEQANVMSGGDKWVKINHYYYNTLLYLYLVVTGLITGMSVMLQLEQESYIMINYKYTIVTL